MRRLIPIISVSRVARVFTTLLVLCLSCSLQGCSAPTQSASQGDYEGTYWFVRQVTKGEVVPLEGPHQHFQVFEDAIPLSLEGDRFRLAFDLSDGRSRELVFQVHLVDPRTVELSCPLSNLEPRAEDLLWEDRRLNEAISEHIPVRVPSGEWTTFFNDHLSGVFSSDWQLWWGETPPPETGK